MKYAICSNMDEPGDHHTKWSKSDRERQISYDIVYMQNLKNMIQMNLFTKQKQTNRFREWTYGYQGGRVEGRNRLGVWDWQVHTAIFKIDNQQGPTVKKNSFIHSLNKHICIKKDVVHIYNGILLSHKKEQKQCHLQQHGWT